jgi:DNA repair exonuclease SbcCD nuclease subunit
MAKIAIMGDLHLNLVVYTKIYDDEFIGLPFRNGDFMRSFRTMVDKCIDEIKPDLVVIPGDVYDYYEPTNDVRGFFSKQLERFSEQKIPVIILIGNHDVCKKHHALKDLQELKLKHIRVIEEPEIVKYKDIQLLLFPYSLDIERGVVTIKEEFNKFKKLFKEKDDGSEAVFFGHFGVKGASLSEYNIKRGKDIKVKGDFLNDSDKDVSCADLDSLGAKHFILGDYHKTQVLDTKKCHAMYTGSIEKTDFSEIDQKKGFMVYDSDATEDKKFGKCKFVEYTGCRPLLELSGNLTDMQAQFTKKNCKNLQKAIVKFKFEGTKEESTTFYLGLRKFKKEITDKISPIYMVHEKKIKNSQMEEDCTALQDEIAQKGCIEGEDVLSILKEMIDEREKDKKESELLKNLITDIYNKNRGTN